MTKHKGAHPHQGLGTFNGVYLPSILTIFGVIMYLRLGYVVGSVRLGPAITIIVLSSLITLLTSLSIAASVTNMKVKGGGAYYLISRAFGKELGAAIGLPLFLAQSIGISFYIAGFVESLSPFLPGVSPALSGIVTLVALTALAYTSTSLAVKTQGIILVAVVASLVSFFAGSEASATVTTSTAYKLSFWPAFALFFPAVTGIETGIAMSGDLKNPTRSLVIGTIGAVLTGLVVYLAMAWFLWAHVPRERLLADPLVVLSLARWKWLVIAGLWGATFSSALGGVMGAPRTLQALANDGLAPPLLAKGYGPSNEPRLATLVTCLISGACVVLGRIDIIAPILTMFFLISYGMLNLAAGLEGLTQNPSWRPTFRVPPLISLIGALLVTMAMFMIDPGASFVAIAAVIFGYYAMARSKLSEGWDDIRQGLLLLLSRCVVYRLAGTAPSPRSWRPNFLVFTDGYSASDRLLQFTSHITQGRGFLTVASVFSSVGERINLDVAQNRIRGLFRKRNVEALVAVTQERDPVEGIEHLIDNYGLGPLQPNTIVVGDTLSPDTGSKVPRIIMKGATKKKNVVVIVGDPKRDFVEEEDEGEDPITIDVWWDDESKKNSELMLVLAHMHQRTGCFGSVEVNLKCTVRDEAGREQRREFFETFFSNSRLKVETHVYVTGDDDDIPRLKNLFSKDADVVLHGFRLPKEGETLEEYAATYKAFVKSNKQLKNVVYTIASEPVDMNAIFC